MSKAHKIQAEVAAALEALDVLDLAFGNKFGMQGLDASDIIADAMNIVEKVSEIAARLDEPVAEKTAIVGAVFATNNEAATGVPVHCGMYAVVASTIEGTMAYETLFNTSHDATMHADGVRFSGVITPKFWSNVELQG